MEQLQIYVQQQRGGEVRWCELIKSISKQFKVSRKDLRVKVQAWCKENGIKYRYR